jgi:hypothetical protein
MIGVYKALLPRVQADLRQGAWTHMPEFSSVAEDPHHRFWPVAERAYPAGVLVLDDLAVYALREPARQQLERLLQYRARKGLPTFFIADNLELLRERAGAAIAALLLAQCVVVEVYGPNLYLLMGARNSPEQAAEHPDWYDAYEYLRNAQRAAEDAP